MKESLVLERRTCSPFGNCSDSGFGGRGGGAGEDGRAADCWTGSGGGGEMDRGAEILALEARRRWSSAKAAEAKGRWSGLSASVGSRLTVVTGKEILRKEVRRAIDGCGGFEGKSSVDGNLGRDFAEVGRAVNVVVNPRRGCEVVEFVGELVGSTTVSLSMVAVEESMKRCNLSSVVHGGTGDRGVLLHKFEIQSHIGGDQSCRIWS